jgi:hypothetical protein
MMTLWAILQKTSTIALLRIPVKEIISTILRNAFPLTCVGVIGFSNVLIIGSKEPALARFSSFIEITLHTIFRQAHMYLLGDALI